MSEVSTAASQRSTTNGFGRTGLLVIAIVLAAMALLALTLVFRAEHRSRVFVSAVPRIKRDFAPVIEWIQSEKARTGYYPPALPPAFMTLGKGYGPKFSYGIVVDGNRVVAGFKFGDYMLDGGELTWNTESGWYLDE